MRNEEGMVLIFAGNKCKVITRSENLLAPQEGRLGCR